MNTLTTGRPQISGSALSMSAASASRYADSGMPLASGSCELKSQYGHLRTHHGKWTYSDSGGNAGSDSVPGRINVATSGIRAPATGLISIEEGTGGAGRGQAQAAAILRASSAIARPRWLMRFFSAGSSSAAVLPRSGQQEQRVVAEAAAAARLVDDLAVPARVGDQRLRVVRRAHGGQHARVVRAPVAFARQPSQQFVVVARVVGRFAGKARGQHARCALQRGRADARVVGERRQPGRGRRVARLRERVLQERGCGSSAGATFSSVCGITSHPRGASRWRNSRSLPGLPVAMTMRRVIGRNGGHQPDAPALRKRAAKQQDRGSTIELRKDLARNIAKAREDEASHAS